MNNPLSATMQIFDKDGETVLHELVIITLLTKKPEKAYPKNEYQQREMTVPLDTGYVLSGVLPDCTFLAETANKVIRFTAEGTTAASLPSDVLILSKEEFDRIQEPYFTQVVNGKMTYQTYLWALYDHFMRLAKTRKTASNSEKPPEQILKTRK